MSMLSMVLLLQNSDAVLYKPGGEAQMGALDLMQGLLAHLSLPEYLQRDMFVSFSCGEVELSTCLSNMQDAGRL
jgi:hypothetical protein